MTTFEQVREIICDQMGLDEEEVTLEASLSDDIQADSVDIMQMVFTIEETFPGVKFPLDDELHISTVGELIDFIEENMQK